jgi:hypothetical protein
MAEGHDAMPVIKRSKCTPQQWKQIEDLRNSIKKAKRTLYFNDPNNPKQSRVDKVAAKRKFEEATQTIENTIRQAWDLHESIQPAKVRKVGVSGTAPTELPGASSASDDAVGSPCTASVTPGTRSVPGDDAAASPCTASVTPGTLSVPDDVAASPVNLPTRFEGTSIEVDIQACIEKEMSVTSASAAARAHWLNSCSKQKLSLAQKLLEAETNGCDKTYLKEVHELCLKTGSEDGKPQVYLWVLEKLVVSWFHSPKHMRIMEGQGSPSSESSEWND